ncbi:MAG: hypothetical protein N2253_06170 [Bacteroidia bacterium]|nr:hypothetical protein [Bacteroidia bacterium]
MSKFWPFLHGIQFVLHWLLEFLLSYIVGAPVKVSRIEQLSISWGSRWEVHLRGVQVQGTLEGDPSPAAFLGKVSLYGHQGYIDSIKIHNGTINLIRLGKKEKNFRFFPRRRRSSPTQAFLLQADSVRLRIDNFPPGVFLHTVIRAAHARLFIDSSSVRLSDLNAALQVYEACISDTLQPFPSSVQLHFSGRYEKASDLWSDTQLNLIAPEGSFSFTGQIDRWEEPYGHLGGVLQNDFLRKLMPGSSSWLADDRLYFTGEVKKRSYEAHLSGPWRAGEYDLCLQGEKSSVSHVAGKISIHPWGFLYVSGTLSQLRIRGHFILNTLQAAAEGTINLSNRIGKLYLRDALGSAVSLQGSDRHLTIKGHLQNLPFEGEWRRDKGIEMRIDTADVDSLRRAVSPYLSLFKGKGNLPVEIQARQLRSSHFTLTSARLRAHKGALRLEGEAAFSSFPVRAGLRLTTNAHLDKGNFALHSSEGYLYGEWRGDSVGVSGTARWNEVLLHLQAHTSPNAAYLWIDKAEGVFASGEKVYLRGALTKDSADVQLSGTVPLPWVLFHLPLPGLIVWEGQMGLSLCAQGRWDTLLQWNNPTEGTITLAGVRGAFYNLGLPLQALSCSLTYTPEATYLRYLKGRVGSLEIHAEGEVESTLSYLYTDWHHLKGHLRLRADNLVLSEFWRKVEGEKVYSRVRFPSQMDASVEVSLHNAETFGMHIDSAYITAHIQGPAAAIDSFSLSYAHSLVRGRAYMDMQDSGCYSISGKVIVNDLPIERLLKDLSLTRVPTFSQIGLRGRFSGTFQAHLRLSPEVTWLRQSSIYAEGSISAGKIRTPRFMRWLRPYYLNAYKDSMDFYAHVSGLSVNDGFMRISEAFLLSRIAAISISGHHLLPSDQFLYRIQAVRVRRRIQRYPNLELLTDVFSELIDRSIGLIYVEKEKGKVRWWYPWRYFFWRLFHPPRRVF